MITKEQFLNLLEDLGACNDAVEWFSSFDGTLEDSWLQCERGDWMLWLLARLKTDRKKIVLSACGCARLVLHLTSDERVLVAIETAEAWTRGEATSGDLDGAAWAAWAAARAAEAAEAARAAARAAEAAWAAAWAAEAAARAAAWAAARAAEAAEAVRDETLKQCANIVKQNFEFDEVFELAKSKIEVEND